MDNERFQILTDAYLSGTLTDADAAELLQALKASGELRTQLRGQVSMAQLIERRFADHPQALTRQVMAGLRNPEQKAGVVTSIMRDLDWPAAPKHMGASTIHAPIFFPTRRHRNWFVIGSAVAAALLIVGGLGAYALMNFHSTNGSAGLAPNSHDPNSPPHDPSPNDDQHIAVVQAIDGLSTVLRGGQKLSLSSGFHLLSQDILEVESRSVTFEYQDGTRVSALINSQLVLQPAELKDSAHIGLFLRKGRLEASVTKQPVGKPMMVQTPHATATILGTRFDLQVTGGESKLVVTEGAIAFASTAQNESVVVKKDHSAVVAPNMRLDTMPLTRDPALWPFSADSPWNKAIGSQARFAAVESPKFDAARGMEFLADAYSIPVVIGKPEDPERLITNRQPDRTGHLNVHMPLSAKPEPSHLGHIDIIDEQHTRVFEMLGARTELDGSISVYLAHKNPLKESGVFPPGVEKGTHMFGGSSLGGLVRRGELNTGIRHALACSVPITALNSETPTGRPYVWPASHAREDWVAHYGKNGNLHLGSLLAIPATVDLSKTGVGNSGPAYEVAKALQDYGVYVVEHLDHQDSDLKIFCETGIQNEIGTNLGGRLTAVMAMLQVVTNNSDTSIGGGGTPCRAPAPPFAPEFNDAAANPKIEGNF